MNRQNLLRAFGAIGAAVTLPGIAPPYARTGLVPLAPAANNERLFEFVVDAAPFGVGSRATSALAINGSVPAPLLHAREGETAIVRVTNRLKESTSIHWHGVLVPNAMDGVPGVTFRGIEPGQTFTYRIPIRQNGTYWFHSHSGLQEQVGVYGPIVLDPADRDPVAYDREYVVMLSDWTFDNPMTLIEKLRKDAGYFNFQKLTAADYMKMARKEGRDPSPIDNSEWARMRMDPTDLADVSAYAYTYLMNGLTPEANWTPLFKPGEKVRLRVIGGAAMTTFDLRIPGLRMTVVQADGQNVKPVVVDEFRVAPGETYDVLVQPTDDRAYPIFAETMDRSGYARGTLAPRAGMTAAVPARRPRPLLSMNDMGMDMSSMKGMDMSGGAMAGMDMSGGGKPAAKGGSMAGMDMSGKTANPAPSSSSTPMPGMTMNGGSMPGMDMSTPKPSLKAASERSQQMSGMDMHGMSMPGMNMKASPRPGAHSLSRKSLLTPKPKPSAGPHRSSDPMSGMAGMSGMAMGSAARTANPSPSPSTGGSMRDMRGMDMSAKSTARTASSAMSGMDMRSGSMSSTQTALSSKGAYLPGSPPVMHGPGSHGVENSMVPMQETNRLAEPGPGLENAGHRVLVYTDLKSLNAQKDRRDPIKTLELHLTGNMERYMWSFDGKKYSEAGAFEFRRGERVRMILVNDTMMEHPIHLHGMYMELENGAGGDQPYKHTIRVKPAERLSVAITPDDPGDWALHCHLLMHMELGMMRVVRVTA